MDYFNKSITQALILIGLLFFTNIIKAETLVLIHGLFGGHSSWDKSHISNILEQHGFQKAGFVFTKTPNKTHLNITNYRSENRFISVTLPAHSPLENQANLLKISIDKIRATYPNEAIHLIGHSAGGVVARLFLVSHFTPQIKSLITIASPHLGLKQAKFAKNMADLPQPFNFMAQMIGGDVYDEFETARVYFHQLQIEQPNNFLFELNRKPHPPIHYISIIHNKKSFVNADLSIPPYSQNMNNIVALKGRVFNIFINAPHKLVYKDGLAIVNILKNLRY